VRAIVAARAAYGSTRIGALVDRAVEPALQRRLSTQLVMSHAAAWARVPRRRCARSSRAGEQPSHGYSACALRGRGAARAAAHGVVPDVPREARSIPAHMAHISLVLIGEGMRGSTARHDGPKLWRAPGCPLVLEAKEGLSLINGGRAPPGSARWRWPAKRAVASADGVAALQLRALGGNPARFAPIFRLRVRRNCRDRRFAQAWLAGSAHLAACATARPAQLAQRSASHGAVRDALAHVARMIDDELPLSR